MVSYMRDGGRQAGRGGQFGREGAPGPRFEGGSVGDHGVREPEAVSPPSEFS